MRWKMTVLTGLMCCGAATASGQIEVHEYHRFVGSDGSEVFGFTLEADADRVLVGEDSNRIHQFRKIDGLWVEDGSFDAPNGRPRSFSLEDDWLAVGNADHHGEKGIADVFQWTGDAWEHRATLDGALSRGDRFGHSIALRDDLVVVGAPRGAYARVYRRGDGSWPLEDTLGAGDHRSGSDFGMSVTIADDVVIVGAPDALNDRYQTTGAAYVFEHGGGQWRETQKLALSTGSMDEFGMSVDAAGRKLAVGAPGRGEDYGAVYLYEADGNKYKRSAKIDPPSDVADGYFGQIVDLLSDRVAVLFPRAYNGRVEIYELPSIDNPIHARTLSARESDTAFGTRMAVDGEEVFVSAYCGDDPGYVLAFNDLPLRPNNHELFEGAPLIVDIEGGLENALVLLGVIDPDFPSRIWRLDLGPFDDRGCRSYQTTVPPGLDGLVLDLRAIGISSFGTITDSNRARLVIN